MSFYFAYIDEYGDPGTSLDYTKDPIFMLSAALVHPTQWSSLEVSLNGILTDMRKIPGLENLERLHATDLYQRKKPFRVKENGLEVERISIPEAFEFFERILSTIKDHEVIFIPQCVDKYEMIEVIYKRQLKNLPIEVNKDVFADQIKKLKLDNPMYMYCFYQLLLYCNQYCVNTNSFTTLLLDQHNDFNFYANLAVYSELRQQQFIPRILESPLFADSRKKLLLAVPDFLSYVFGAMTLIRKGHRERPRFLEWHKNYVQPMMPHPNLIFNPPETLETTDTGLQIFTNAVKSHKK